MINRVKENLTKAMKARNSIEMGALRMLLASMQTLEATQGESLNESQGISLVKKLINQNNEEISARAGHDEYSDTIAKLQAENVVLGTYLPNFLSSEKITEILSDHLPRMSSAKSSGAAVGVAMKILAPHGAVEGKTVKDVVDILYMNLISKDIK